jgi:hypothetical protein
MTRTTKGIRVVARYRAGRAPDGLSWGPLPAASATIAR